MKTICRFNQQLLGLVFVILSQYLSIFAQDSDNVQPFNYGSYQYELNHPTYQYLLLKISKGDSLTNDEERWLIVYREYLKNSLGFLSQVEKQKVFNNYNLSFNYNDSLVDAYTNKLLFKEASKVNSKTALIQHIAHSGMYGVYYGIALYEFAELDGAVAGGLTFLVSGLSMLYPILDHQKYSNISDNSLWLRAHGKFIGISSGLALSALLFGDGFFDKYDYPDDYNYDYDWEEYDINPNYKASMAISAISSISLGALGFYYGKTKDWDEGRVSLYRHYSVLNSCIGAGLVYATGTYDTRWYGASILLSCASGYHIADKIADKTNFTRGDMLAAAGFTSTNAGLGFGLVLDLEDRIGGEEESIILIPIATGILGNVISHKHLQGLRLTRQQGRRVNLAMVGGSLIGLGLALMLESERVTPYYALPYATGISSYYAALNYYKKDSFAFNKTRKRKFDYTFQLNPENLIYNYLANNNQNMKSKMVGNLPVANFSVRF